MRRRSTSLTRRRVARIRSVRLFRWSWKVPRRDRPQMWVNPRKQCVQDVAHLGAGDPDRERIERVVRPAPGPEAIREPEEVLLVDRVQHRCRGPLDYLALQRREGQRALAAVRLGDEP